MYSHSPFPHTQIYSLCRLLPSSLNFLNLEKLIFDCSSFILTIAVSSRVMGDEEAKYNSNRFRNWKNKGKIGKNLIIFNLFLKEKTRTKEEERETKRSSIWEKKRKKTRWTKEETCRTSTTKTSSKMKTDEWDRTWRILSKTQNLVIQTFSSRPFKVRFVNSA